MDKVTPEQFRDAFGKYQQSQRKGGKIIGHQGGQPISMDDLKKILGIDLLTDAPESDIIPNMSDKVTPLIPQAETYIKNGFNVLLVGPHGTGKTQSVFDLAEQMGLKVKYYSCSTLDPYTDLVGVPTPQVDEETGQDYLKMVRPRDVDEAEFIFFDEFNRATPQTLNAIFEIIQFRSINGEPLPNLKACWAAMNPPDEDYQVEEVDPALLDRFDLYIEVLPKPDEGYMSRFVSPDVARALMMWWNEHTRSVQNKSAGAGKVGANKDTRVDYISPRRLMKIGLVWEATKNGRSVKASLPMGGTFDSGKLIRLLRAASEGESLGGGNAIGDAASPDFQYTPSGLLSKKKELVEFLTQNPLSLETHQKVALTLEQGVGGPMLMKRYAEILDSLNASILEGLFTKMPPVKQSQVRGGFKELYDSNPNSAKKLKNLYGIISKNARPGTLPTI